MKFKKIIITFVIVQFVELINCETVHFTNSPNYLVRKKNFTTYKLDMPDSNSITIVEANTPSYQHNNSNYQDQQNSESSILESASTINKKTVYAPSLLEKFMNQYNIKVASAQIPQSENNNDNNNNNNNKDDSKVLVKRGYDGYLETDDNYHGQSYHQNHHHHNNNNNNYQTRPLSSLSDKRNPFNEKEGWVTLQAVPWSKSQVSKWKPKAEVKPLSGNNNYGGYNSFSTDSQYGSPGYAMYQKEILNKWSNNNDMDTSSSSYQNLKPNFYDHNHENTENLNYDDENNRRQSMRPSFDSVPWNTDMNKSQKRPNNNEKPLIEVASNFDRWYDYGFRPDLDRFEKRPQQPPHLPNYNSDSNNNNNNNNNNNDQIESILLNSDGYSAMRSPLKKPKPYSNNDRITIDGSSELQYKNQFNNRHPNTHPSKGKGEWVLVSTTKGYQHPPPTHSVPRGIQYNKQNDEQLISSLQPNNYRTHKSIKLTVLPAKTEDGKLKPMSLSHGGLLEVESSSQTVEDSANAAFLNTIRNKKTKKIVKRTPLQFVQAVPVNNQKIDKSAVLAAVSAGMIPATMAMIMPMVLGRKKRSLFNQRINNDDEFFYNRKLFRDEDQFIF